MGTGSSSQNFPREEGSLIDVFDDHDSVWREAQVLYYDRMFKRLGAAYYKRGKWCEREYDVRISYMQVYQEHAYACMCGCLAVWKRAPRARMLACMICAVHDAPCHMLLCTPHAA